MDRLFNTRHGLVARQGNQGSRRWQFSNIFNGSIWFNDSIIKLDDCWGPAQHQSSQPCLEQSVLESQTILQCTAKLLKSKNQRNSEAIFCNGQHWKSALKGWDILTTSWDIETHWNSASCHLDSIDLAEPHVFFKGCGLMAQVLPCLDLHSCVSCRISSERANVSNLSHPVLSGSILHHLAPSCTILHLISSAFCIRLHSITVCSLHLFAMHWLGSIWYISFTFRFSVLRNFALRLFAFACRIHSHSTASRCTTWLYAALHWTQPFCYFASQDATLHSINSIG